MRTLVLASLLFTACEAETDFAGTPLGVALEDGQVVVGEIQTDVLRLDGAFGELQIPLDDVGAIFPAEGDRVGDGGGGVTVWLRNGGELRGVWAEPELRLGLEVGGAMVPIDLPVDGITGVQTRGEAVWPDREVFRVKTTWGDDFLVDAEASQLALENDLGTFAPFLSECVSAAPIGDPTGDWRIELVGGTVLIGPLVDGEVTFLLPMGPESVTVVLDDFVSLQRESWGYSTSGEAEGLVQSMLAPVGGLEAVQGAGATAPNPDVADRFVDLAVPERPARQYRTPALSSGAGWFDQRGLEVEKSKKR
ncbi:MAG: hypothetical protein KC912_03930 [Proteobacteria bacterium]|nr:hypothetical protein [Pseudomonadota bacterium]